MLSSEYKGSLPKDFVAKGWLGNPGATEAQLQFLEERLKTTLPPSYRAFLAFSNGWEGIDPPFIDRLWSTDQIEWFVKRHEDWIEDWIDDGSLSEEQYRTERIRKTSRTKYAHLKAALEISMLGDGAIMLLDPQIINEFGEWEALDFSNGTPGVWRFPSFWAMMVSRYKIVQWLANEK